MRLGTVLLSATIHVGLAVGLISAQQTRALKKKTISVAVTGEKKKEAKPKPPPPLAPPRRSAPKVAATLAKAEAIVPAHAAAAAPIATNLTMSNEDIGPGIGLAGAAPRGAARAAPAAMKVASAISDRRTRMAREQAEGTAGEGSCNEPPTEPVPVVTTEINYSLYPQAQQDGIEGLFKARIVVGADGDVVDVQVVSGVDPAFDAAIKAALMRWRFKPSTMCGKPVAGGVHKFKARFELAD
jgi:TonB family protein